MSEWMWLGEGMNEWRVNECAVCLSSPCAVCAPLTLCITLCITHSVTTVCTTLWPLCAGGVSGDVWRPALGGGPRGSRGRVDGGCQSINWLINRSMRWEEENSLSVRQSINEMEGREQISNQKEMVEMKNDWLIDEKQNCLKAKNAYLKGRFSVIVARSADLRKIKMKGKVNCCIIKIMIYLFIFRQLKNKRKESSVCCCFSTGQHSIKMKSVLNRWKSSPRGG